MSRVKPLRPEEVPESLRERQRQTVERMGFLPSSSLILARKPKISAALGALAMALNGPDMKLPRDLRALIANMASRSAGCMYCVAHSASGLNRAGVPDAKIAAVWQYESSPLFNAAERAAMRVAQAAASVPNAVTDEDFVELRKHFAEEEIVEIVAIIAYFGWLNRWNDTLATELEDMPLAVAERVLAPTGWKAGKHAPGRKPRQAAE